MAVTTEELVGLLNGDSDSFGYISASLLLEICRRMRPPDAKVLANRCFGTTDLDEETIDAINHAYTLYRKLKKGQNG